MSESNKRQKIEVTEGEMVKQVGVVVIGVGGVGRALLKQIMTGRKHHLRRYGVQFNVKAVVDSSGFAAVKAGLSDETLLQVISSKEAGSKLKTFKHEAVSGAEGSMEQVCGEFVDATTVLVDCSATEKTVPHLIGALKTGGGIAMANKKPLTVDQASFDLMARGPMSSRARYESTVGAGTPMVAAMERLVGAGDKISKIEGTFSGTLGFVMTGLETGKPYSEVVGTAYKLGYTEPDPRDDLGGVDVARKALILARTMGWDLEMKDVEVEPLYPKELADVTVEKFISSLGSLDAEYSLKNKEAAKENKVLRYVASIADNKCTVGLKALAKDHPIGRLQGTQNMIAFYTEHFGDSPLVVQGAGAGVEVTAAGILADMVDLAPLLSASAKL